MKVDLDKLSMKDIDVASFVEQQGGVELYMELLELFYMDGMKRVGLLKELIEKPDISRYVIEVHGLKGAAANIGAKKLSELARGHEMAGKASDITYIKENADALFESYNSCLDEIKRVLKQQQFGQFAEKEDGALEQIGVEDMAARIREIQLQLESFKAKNASDGVGRLLGCAIPNEVRTQLEQVQALLKMYEHDKAEKLLQDLIQNL